MYLVSEERPDDYENRLDSVDLEKIISLTELFILESLPLYDINKLASSEPLKQNFLIELQSLSEKLKWYSMVFTFLMFINSNNYNDTKIYRLFTFKFFFF